MKMDSLTELPTGPNTSSSSKVTVDDAMDSLALPSRRRASELDLSAPRNDALKTSPSLDLLESLSTDGRMDPRDDLPFEETCLEPSDRLDLQDGVRSSEAF